eukprot:CAMPEP_0174376626 /NCGR_PEP_ID=MMETSP0811_2-20130205/118787_1 /TAXON_ID=73025 ORGANISM="Eutreptiella gymnastica-like, Strain CCMP1594" /NCGR_SAMPLE_ID=MMETSP0811_2 /ASSEMBLY_ACC=CAM_ASM_000667 /LENGTH=35 /DNA_ID= /DNA_START= /DNA_END= /DNA_ORIENTATION=
MAVCLVFVAASHVQGRPGPAKWTGAILPVKIVPAA